MVRIAGDALTAAVIAEIRSERASRGWTQAQLAAQTAGAVSSHALSGYETGHRTPGLPVAQVLATALGMDLSMLILRAELRIKANAPVQALKVRLVLESTNPEMAPLRAWLKSVYGAEVKALDYMPVTTTLLEAAAHLMNMTLPECRRRLASYLDRPQV